VSVSLNILLVDDSEDDRYFFERTLRRLGRNTRLFIAEDGDAAITFLENSAQPACEHPMVDIIFLDLKMPGRNGFDVLRWMNEKPFRSVKVIVLSGSQQPADIKLAKDLGAHGYMVKPATPESLSEWLK
jgi:CheY-like chemotaxis protein